MNKSIDYYMSLPYKVVIIPDRNGGMTIYIPDLPGCISQGDTLEDAYKMIEDAKRAWIETALKEGIAIPEPDDEEYSGKFVVRVPKSLHKMLTIQAQKEGVSLNQYINYKLQQDKSFRP